MRARSRCRLHPPRQTAIEPLATRPPEAGLQRVRRAFLCLCVASNLDRRRVCLSRFCTTRSRQTTSTGPGPVLRIFSLAKHTNGAIKRTSYPSKKQPSRPKDRQTTDGRGTRVRALSPRAWTPKSVALVLRSRLGGGGLLGLVGDSDGLVGGGLLGGSLGNDGVVDGNLVLLGLGSSLLERSEVPSSLESEGGHESLDGGAEQNQKGGLQSVDPLFDCNVATRLKNDAHALV